MGASPLFVNLANWSAWKNRPNLNNICMQKNLQKCLQKFAPVP